MMGISQQLSDAATVWSDWMLAMGWQVLLLAGLIWVITRFCGRCSAGFKHLLWLLVFLKLVIPPTLATPWSPGTAVQHLTKATLNGNSITIGNYELRPRGELSQVVSSPEEQESTQLAAPVQPSKVSTPVLLGSLWLAVALILGIGLAWNYGRYTRSLLREAVPAPPAMCAVQESESDDLKLRHPPRVMLHSGVTTPAVFGVLNPVILLPATMTTNDPHLRNILRHELAHSKRRDLPLCWIASLLLCVYWFHPAVWLAYFYLRREMEMACDDMALRGTDEEKNDYPATLVRVAEGYRGGLPAAAGFLGLPEAADNLLHRVRAAADPKRTRHMGIRSLAGVLLAGLLLLPMAVWVPVAAQETGSDALEAEIKAHYAKADPDVQEYIRWTARTFRPSGLWMDADTFDDLSDAEKKEKAEYYGKALQGEYGRHLCASLAAAGVLKDPALIPGLVKVASYHREDSDYDCRPKWMGVAALGRQDDLKQAYVLIPLVDHGNMNTRMWARASLVRLTGENFSDDKKAWGEWWNATDNTPKLSDEDLAPWKIPGEEVEGSSENIVPLVVDMHPPKGTTDVDPTVTELHVTFNTDMDQSGYSWTGGGELFPEVTDTPKWLDAHTCVLPVKLEAGKPYRVGINSSGHKNFKSTNGVPAQLDVLYFATKGWDGGSFIAPKAVKLVPENNANNVSPERTELTVTFDQSMGNGFSWVTLDDKFPEITDKPKWSEDKKTCTMGVKLEAGKNYRLGLNHEEYKNFQNENGVPLEPIIWEFSTAE